MYSDLGVLEDLDSAAGDIRIEYPSTLLIWSLKATPYAIERSTGTLYNFTDYIIGNNVSFPSNQLELGFSVEQTASFEKDFSNIGFDLFGWKMEMTYQPNTLQIPRWLSITDDTGNEYDQVKLSSADWSKRRIYSGDFLSYTDKRYSGKVQGNLVTSNLDGSGKWFPFLAAMYFNMSL